MAEEGNNYQNNENKSAEIVPDEAFEYKEKSSSKNNKGLWIVITGIGAVLFKLKGILFIALGKLKFLFIILKLGKFLSTFGSMLFMIVIYAQLYGWKFGVGFVLLILIHEMGHYYTAKIVGLAVSAPLFIPFMGAFINMKELPKNAVVEANVALGGPVLGTLGALLCAVAYIPTGNNLFLALAYSGFMINLFNLVPVHPLDGGRIVSAISPKLWFVGIPVLLVSAIYFFNPIIILFLILGCVQVYKFWKNPETEYYDTPVVTRVIFASAYLGLMLLLGIGMYYIHELHS